jgi:MFS family permease
LLIPLWGSALGLDLAQIGLIFGLAAAVDMTLFLPVGFVMDRWGRKWTIVPSLLTLAAAMALVPLTTNFATFLAVGLLSGLGNGLGSGAVQVMGADLAPPERIGEFLGVWRVIADTGAIFAPLSIGALAQALTLGISFLAPVVVGVAGAALLLFVVPETRRRDREHEP